MDNEFALLGCPSCSSYIISGKPKFICRLKPNTPPCQQNKKCPMRTRVYDILAYMDKSDDIEELKEAMKDIARYLRENR